MRKILFGALCLSMAIGLLIINQKKTEPEIAAHTPPISQKERDENPEQREMEEWTEEQIHDAKAVIKERKKAKSNGNEKSASLLVDIEEEGPNVNGETISNPYQKAAGGMIKEISVDFSDTDGIQSNDRLVVATETGGAWISEDAGANWYPIDDDWAFSGLNTVAQNPFQPEEYYFGGEFQGLFRWDASAWTINGSNNSGLESLSPTIYANGSTYNEFRSCKVFRFHPTNNNHFYLVGGVSGDFQGLYETTDGGNTFYEIFDINGPSFDDMEVLSDKIILATTNGIYKLTKSGSNWNGLLVKGAVPGCSNAQVAVLEEDPNIVYTYTAQLGHNYQVEISRSMDGGNTWNSNNSQTLISAHHSQQHSHALQVTTYDSNYHLLMYGSQKCQIAYVYNSGALSISPEQRHFGHDDYQDIQVFGDDLYVGSDGGIFRYNINALQYNDPPTVFDPNWYQYVVSEESLNATFRTYQSVDVALAANGNRKLMAMWHNGTSFKENNAVEQVGGGDGFEAAFMPGNDSKYYTTAQRGAVRTQDPAGGSFNPYIGNTAETRFNTRIFTHSALPNELFMVGTYRFWQLNNASTCLGNCPWDLVYDYGINNNIYSYARLENQVNSPVYLAIGSSPQIDKINSLNPASKVTLTNDFSNLTPATSPGAIFDMTINPQNTNELFVLAGNKPFKIVAHNGTAIWYSINDPNLGSLSLNEIAVSPDNSNQLILGTSLGVYCTVDGGLNWDVVPEIPAVAVEDIEVREDGYVGIATYGRGNWTAQLNGNVCELDDVNNTFSYFKKKGSMFFTSPFDEPGYDYLWTASGNFYPTFTLGFNPGISYSFASNGLYNVCLTITSQTDPSCTKTICRNVSTSGFFGFIGFMLPKGDDGEELALQFEADVYPNPASDLLNVRFSESIEGTALIYNMQGQLVHEFSINGNTAQVELQEFISGNYIIAVVSDEQLIAREQFSVNK